MRRSVGFLMTLCLLLLTTMSFARSAMDKSILLTNIVTTNAITNWVGTNYGWDADDLLINGQWTLSYPMGSTNSVSNTGQYQITPTRNSNIGEPGDDSQMLASANSSGEIYGLWLTWDTNGLYYAIRSESEGRGNNIMIVFDRVRGVGSSELSKMNSGWKRNINYQEIKPDLYVGFWGNNNSVDVGGYQVWSVQDLSSTATPTWYKVGEKTSSAPFANQFKMSYNGLGEDVHSNRVVLGFMAWSLITKGMPDTNNLTLRVAVVSTGPDDGSPVYDFCPDNLGGVDINNPGTFSENYFEVTVISNGCVLTNVSPRFESKVIFLPGSLNNVFSKPTNMNIPVDNYGNQTTYLFPDKGGFLQLNIPNFDQIGYLGRANISIYNLYGQLITTIYNSDTSIKPGQEANLLKWDGKDANGNIMGTGIYMIVVSGQNPSGAAVSLKYYINLIR